MCAAIANKPPQHWALLNGSEIKVISGGNPRARFGDHIIFDYSLVAGAVKHRNIFGGLLYEIEQLMTCSAPYSP